MTEAKFLIAETFAAPGNKWNESDQKYYLASLGIDSTLQRLDQAQTKTVLDDLIKCRMILISTAAVIAKNDDECR